MSRFFIYLAYFLMMASSAQSQSVTVQMLPQPSQVPYNGNFWYHLQLKFQGINHFGTFQIQLKWDATALQYLDHDLELPGLTVSQTPAVNNLKVFYGSLNNTDFVLTGDSVLLLKIQFKAILNSNLPQTVVMDQQPGFILETGARIDGSWKSIPTTFDPTGITIVDCADSPPFQLPIASVVLCPGEIQTIDISCAFCADIWVNDSLLVQPNFMIDSSGQYVVRASIAATGCLVSDTIIAQILPKIMLPEEDFAKLCPDKMVTIGIDTIQAGTSYFWPNNTTLPTIQVGAIGTYTLTLVNDLTCEDTVKTNIYVSWADVPNLGFLTDTIWVCSGSEAILCPTDTLSDWQWLWLNNGVEQACISVSSDTAQYILEATNIYGCSDTANIWVLPLPLPLVDLPQDTTTCPGTTIGLVNPIGNGQILWSTGDNTAEIMVDSAHTYYVTVTDLSGCAAMDSILVLFLEAPLLALTSTPGDSIVCYGTTVDLVLGGTVDEIIWDSPNGNMTLLDTNMVTFTAFDHSIITAKWRKGCLMGSVSHAINIHDITYQIPPLITIDFLDSVQLCVEGNVQVRWLPFGQFPDEPCLMFSPDVTTVYGVEIKDEYFCTFLDSLMVVVRPPKEINVFTPNGDGVNDWLELNEVKTRIPDTFLENTLVVWDNWGNPVFEAINYANNWDGTLNGKGNPLPQDTYYFHLMYGPERKMRKGSITILR